MKVWVAMTLALMAIGARADFAGVWKGTLGQQPIVACFNDDSAGSYYYTKFLQPITLVQPDHGAPGQWNEAAKDKPTGNWILSPSSGGSVQGNWQNKNKTLPLALVRVMTAKPDESACASDDYNRDLMASLHLVREKPERMGSHHFRWVRWMVGDEVMGWDHMELLDGGPGVQVFNAGFDKANAAIKAEIAEAEENRMLGMSRNADAASQLGEREMEISFWNKHWLVIRYYYWPAGYGARSIGIWYRTWNMDTGEEVHPWTWFGKHSNWDPDGDRLENNEAVAKGKLASILLPGGAASIEEDSGCIATDVVGLRPGKGGLVADIGGSGCSDHTVPYKKLLPFMTPAAKALVPGLEEK